MFMERFNNQIPLAGTLPDMACSTQWYLQLARVYQDKAAEDRKNMRNLLCEIEKVDISLWMSLFLCST